MSEINAPSLSGSFDRLTGRPEGLFTAPLSLSTHLEAFLMIEPEDELSIHRPALASEHDMDSAVNPSRPLGCDLAYLSSQLRHWVPDRPVAKGRTSEPGEPRCPALGDLLCGADLP
jgi:hypothetical protein